MKMREKAHLLGPRKTIVSVVTTPPRGAAERGRPGVILINAGLVHKIGPNRLNVRIARQLVAHGYTSIRIDLSGIGDSKAHESLPYDEAAVVDTVAAMDFLAKTKGLDRFLLIGLCSGADTFLRVAASDPRVVGACLIDSFAFYTPLYFGAQYWRRMLEVESWRNVVSGNSDIVQMAKGKVREKLRPLLGTPATEPEKKDENVWKLPPKTEILANVRRTVDRGAAMFLIYSGGPAYYNFLTKYRVPLHPLISAGKVQVELFAESDHTFTMTYNQNLLLDCIEGWANALPTTSAANAA